MRGPRGLLRVYAPYAGNARPRVINFISIEPVANGKRGQSEMETGMESGRAGLELRTADSLEEATHPRDAANPSPGRIEKIDGHEALTFFIVPEPFRNGAQPVVQVILRRDRPHEVSLRVFAAKESAQMVSCVLSATMGNYARLRRLSLRDRIVEAKDLWPTFTPDSWGFAPWKTFQRDQLVPASGDLMVSASQNEADPAHAEYDPKVNGGWHYQGERVVQYWRARDARGTVARVNGRRTYWMSDAPIPGGIAFENFEMEAPFRAGQEFTFGVEPVRPEKTELGNVGAPTLGGPRP